MLFLEIYIGFSILTFAMLLIQCYLIEKDLKRKYPDVVSEYLKNNKKNILEKVFIYLKAFVSCFVPIINIGIFYISLFESEKMEEKTLNKFKGL